MNFEEHAAGLLMHEAHFTRQDAIKFAKRTDVVYPAIIEYFDEMDGNGKYYWRAPAV